MRPRTDLGLVPIQPIAHHHVEDAKPAPHAGNHGDFVGFAARPQLGVMRRKGGVYPDRRQRRHVKSMAQQRAATPDGRWGTLPSTLPVERRHAHQRGELGRGAPSQLWQLGHQPGGRQVADARLVFNRRCAPTARLPAERRP